MKPKSSLLAFRPLEISDKDEIKQFLSITPHTLCDYTFADLYLWRCLYNTEWAKIGDFAVFRINCHGKEKLAYLEPLGSGDQTALGEVLDALRNDAHERGDTFRLQFVSNSFIEKNQSLLGDCYIYVDRNYANYVYSSYALSTLAGKKLQPKRNHIHQFLAAYPDYHVEPLTANDKDRAMELCKLWEATRASDPQIAAEHKVIADAFDHFNELGLEGIMLYVGATPIAFTFGSAVNANTFCTHIEKADTQYKTAFAAVNKFLADRLCGRYEFINREEDMGREGLRRAKLSYHPASLAESWFAFERGSEEYKIWKLWQDAFHDDDDFIAHYMLGYSTEKTRVLEYGENGELVGMAHVHLFNTACGKAGYLYALAVPPEYGGKGIATRIVERCVERAREQGALILWTIQGNLKYNAWEHRLGFSATHAKNEAGEPCERPVTDLVLNTPDEFFFGSEDVEDRPLYRILDAEGYKKACASTGWAGVNPPMALQVSLE